MGAFSRPQKTDFPDIPDNLYMAKIAKIEKKIGKNSGKPYTSWGFEVVQPPFVKRWVWGSTWGSTQPTVSPKSKAGQFLTVLGVDISNVDENWDEQSLIGTYVKVLLVTSPEDDDGNKYQNVDRLLAMTEADQQILQMWLSQAQVTGPVKAAVQATPAPVASVPSVPAPVQPMVPQYPTAVTSPVVPQPVAPVNPRRNSPIPF